MNAANVLVPIGVLDTPHGQAMLLACRYPNGGALGVIIRLPSEDGPSDVVFSTNLKSYGAEHALDELCVKNWAENEPYVPLMLATGLFEDTGRTQASGFVQAPVWRLCSVPKELAIKPRRTPDKGKMH